MFDHLTHWQWVALAWLELVVAYGGYMAYLTWRDRRAVRGDADREGGSRP